MRLSISGSVQKCHVKHHMNDDCKWCWAFISYIIELSINLKYFDLTFSKASITLSSSNPKHMPKMGNTCPHHFYFLEKS